MVRIGSGILGWKPAAGAPLKAKPLKAKPNILGIFESLGEVGGGGVYRGSFKPINEAIYARGEVSKTAKWRADQGPTILPSGVRARASTHRPRRTPESAQCESRLLDFETAISSAEIGTRFALETA